ncbi:hypothetical protein GCM10010372_62900 [Streptomyces tauricus]|uniref:hypothetical protein n=1 Tax=Streptomyces tauricus TaxID=68274 RepID=UPI0016742EDC|nr:hypothetical protein [Streptomyces tauricus]GHA54153.1 hypothetical protein GCM10010372_62900 [Streptomyces tauricus]
MQGKAEHHCVVLGADGTVDALLILPYGCVARALPVPTGQDLDATTPVRALGTWLGQPA